MISDYKSASKLDPNNIRAYQNLAIYSFSKGLWSDAIVDFTKLLRVDNNSVLAYSHRGRAHARLRHWEDALSVCRCV